MKKIYLDLYNNTNQLNETIQPWNLVLVNQAHELPSSHEISLIELKDGFLVDRRIYPDLQEMFNEARRSGLSPIIVSAYRTSEEQEALFNQKVNQFLDQEKTLKQDRTPAEKWVALPGFSEHQTGLALDINGENGTSQQVYEWLEENSYKYGFILRYPNGKEDITGINFEPWHFRYVGKQVAKTMYQNHLCLEEYLKQQKQ